MYFRAFLYGVALFSVSACDFFKPHESEGVNSVVQVPLPIIGHTAPSSNSTTTGPSDALKVPTDAEPAPFLPPHEPNDSLIISGGDDGGGLVPVTQVERDTSAPNNCMNDRFGSC